jgi:hypothetical protein
MGSAISTEYLLHANIYYMRVPPYPTIDIKVKLLLPVSPYICDSSNLKLNICGPAPPIPSTRVLSDREMLFTSDGSQRTAVY